MAHVPLQLCCTMVHCGILWLTIIHCATHFCDSRTTHRPLANTPHSRNHIDEQSRCAITSISYISDCPQLTITSISYISDCPQLTIRVTASISWIIISNNLQLMAGPQSMETHTHRISQHKPLFQSVVQSQQKS